MVGRSHLLTTVTRDRRPVRDFLGRVCGGEVIHDLALGYPGLSLAMGGDAGSRALAGAAPGRRLTLGSLDAAPQGAQRAGVNPDGRGERGQGRRPATTAPCGGRTIGRAPPVTCRTNPVRAGIVGRKMAGIQSVVGCGLAVRGRSGLVRGA